MLVYCGYRIGGVVKPSATTPSVDTLASKYKTKWNKKNKKNKHQTQTSEAKRNGEAKVATKTKTLLATKEAIKKSTLQKEASVVNKFFNSLEVEILAIGKPDGK